MAAVRRYEILDTPREATLDRITALAARRLGAPIAVISIVDETRIWFKSHHGLDIDQIGRDPGLCASAILSPQPYILTDAAADPRSKDNPLVTSDFGLRFYVGIPLRSSDGQYLGTLCVLDKRPRQIDQAQIDDLVDLASLVMDQLEARLGARMAASQARLMASETDHRVMNSLQFISAMLRMQSRSADLTDAASQLELAASRIAAVARVHNHFISDDADTFSCITFIRRLCGDLADIVGRAIEVEGDEGDVPTSMILPIGLLVNELVTNAAKHGAGRIDVGYRIDAGMHQLSVCDEGDGLPPGFDPETSDGLGMKVIAALAHQLGGRVTTANRPAGAGSCFLVSFPDGPGPSPDHP